MKIAPLPPNEKKRLEALYAYQILDTESDPDFNGLVELASQLCDTPIALITLIDENRQWFKANIGLGVSETLRDVAFCSHTILEDDVMEVRDASKDERFHDNPFVKEDPKIRFYAAMPLVTKSGYKLGSLCVIDQKPRKLNEKQLNDLRILGKQAMNLLELRLRNIELKQQVIKKEGELRDVFERITDGFFTLDKEWRFTYINATSSILSKRNRESLIGKNIWEEFPQAIGTPTYHAFHKAFTEQITISLVDYHPMPLDIWYEYHIYVTSAGLAVFTRDISERKKSEKLILESKETLERAEELAKLGSWSVDMETGKRYWSKQMFRIYGLEPMELPPNIYSNQELIHPDDRESLDEAYQKMLTGQTPNPSIFRTNPAVLPLKYLLPTWHGIKDTAGKLIRFEGTTQDVTERILAETQITKEKDLSESIINSLPGVLYLFNSSGKFLRWNKNSETVTGYSSAEIAAMHPLQLFDEDEKELLTNRIGEVFTSGYSEVEAHFLLKNKTKIPYYFNGYKIEYENQTCLLGVGIDISVSKNAEAALNLSEAKYRGIFDNALIGIYQSTTDGKFIMANPAMALMFGYSSAEEMIGSITNIGTQIYADQSERVRLRNLIREDGLAMGFEFQAYKKNGAIIWVIDNVRAVSQNGRVQYFEGNLKDITAQKIAEKKLRDSENKLQAFFRSTPDSSALIGKNFEVLAFNEAAVELAKNSRGMELAEGKNWLDYIFPEVRELIKEFIEKAFNGETSQGEFPIINNIRGKGVWWMAVFMPAYDSEGNIFAVVAHSTNIDKLKRTEFTLKKQFEELQKTNSELDKFVYSVSHDLRSPLASIIGLVNVAKMEEPSLAFNNYLTLILQSANRLDGFIKDILDYSQNARTETVPEIIDFDKLIQGTRSHLVMMPCADRLNVFVNIDSQSKFISDKTRLTVVMNNMLSNAIKYKDTNKAESTVHIQVTITENEAVLKFTDNGLGIDERHVDKIFNMFYRASENSKGSGLGLYIVKEAINKLNGTISVQSKFREGTSFTINIPNMLSDNKKE